MVVTSSVPLRSVPDPLFKTQHVFTAFSDTVIRSTPIDVRRPYAFISELRSVLLTQINLVKEGICIRGAVTVGDVVQSWGIVYGPAVVKAYELESSGSRPPLIFVDRESLAELRPYLEREHLGEDLKALLGADESNTYLDYLRAGEAEFDVPDQEYPHFLAAHRDFVRHGLTTYAANGSVLEKYRWLQRYHDDSLAALERIYGIGSIRHLKVEAETPPTDRQET
jgi:hypothetical protein